MPIPEHTPECDYLQACTEVLGGRMFLALVERLDKIHFNLDGIDDPVAAARIGDGLDPIFDGHATAWELSYIRDNPGSWPNVIFYRGGAPVANPFIP